MAHGTGEHQTVGGLLAAFNVHLSKAQLAELSVLLFVFTYAMILLEKFFHRTIAALIGASLVLVIGVITPEKAWEAIDQNTIFLLFGMMNIVTVMGKSGFFHLVAAKAVKLTKGSPARVLWIFSLLTALFSAFLDNVTTVLFMAPVMINIAEKLKLNPIPYLIAIVLASNTGGTATLIGDPPNIIIGSIAGKTFNDFLIEVAPYATLAFLIGLVVMHFMMAKGGFLKSKATSEELQEILSGKVDESLLDRRLMKKSVTVFLITIVLFIVGHNLGLEPGVIALFMATILALISGLSPAWILEKVEWTTLIFFMGLFMVVGALEVNGVFEEAAQWLIKEIGTDIHRGILIVGFTSALISGFVDNIPFTMSMAYVLKGMEAQMGSVMDPLWWSLSLGACLGGNLTIIGASANIVTADIAERNGYKIDFFRFMKYGTPVAVITVVVAILLFYVEHAVFGGI
ncbi:putative tyrosine transporter P-protein [Thermovibrio guaymasensis]|uniref:Putative tyrosine transporter P-protein n=1 Tax=Thermovibrio guaymasensis TaxID=240167 RepID=A0A420W7C8_9BACT|nr:ArsB/NhaD family transporter [Thermovibrio guaymasensis]RKQ63231.1 putative tyrosine transporter P-protein [Thermovibrio guaymasensis]